MLDFNDAPRAILEDAEVRKARVDAAIRSRIRDFVRYLFPRARFNAADARIGDLNGGTGESLSISTARDETCGRFIDHATGERGDLFTLYARVHNLDPKRDFAQVLAECDAWSGGKPAERAEIRHKAEAAKPAEPEPTRTLEAKYVYRDKAGRKICEVNRWALSNGKKTFAVPGGMPAPRPLYNLDRWHASDSVVLVEGEKCVDALASIGIDATTLMGGANSTIEKTDLTPLAGKTVILWPDNDEPGHGLMARLQGPLMAMGCTVRRVSPPQAKPDGWDAADAIAEGFDVAGFLAKPAEPERPRLPIPVAWEGVDPATIPKRRWLYGRYLCRGIISVTVAPGGVGKSSLALVEAIQMATGRKLHDQALPEGGVRVWYINLEDPQDELDRRLAGACLHFGIKYSELRGRLFVNSGIETPMKMAGLTAKNQGEIDEAAFAHVENHIAENDIDAIIVDPFVSSHDLPESDNGMIDRLAKRWARLSQRQMVAVGLVHHTRKGVPGQELDADSARGAGALVAAARVARVLNPMTKEEAAQANIREDLRRLYFRASRDKQNLAPPDADRNWYRMVGVNLGNGTPPAHVDADEVGVAERWTWPDNTNFVAEGARNAREEGVIAALEDANLTDEEVGEYINADRTYANRILRDLAKRGIVRRVAQSRPQQWELCKTVQTARTDKIDK